MFFMTWNFELNNEGYDVFPTTDCTDLHRFFTDYIRRGLCCSNFFCKKLEQHSPHLPVSYAM